MRCWATTLASTLVLAAPACAGGSGGESSFGAGFGDEADSATSDAVGGDEVGDSDDDDDSGDDESGVGAIDCTTDPSRPECDCTAVGDDGAYLLGPCTPHCVDQTWRWSLWATVYNVGGTLGYGEHQGLGLIGYRYEYDPRYGTQDGLPPPWRLANGEPWHVQAAVSEADQFRLRTMAPDDEDYEPAEVVPEDEDDLWPSEQHPPIPVRGEHPVVDGAALCGTPERVFDERYYNHGRTLAEHVPNHAWDSFFGRRDLIPLHRLATTEVTLQHDGASDGPGSASAMTQCLEVIDDGFCESRCGNCSYVMPAGFSGTPFPGADPGHQTEAFPVGASGPHQLDGNGQHVAARVNYSAVEDGHTVWYVGGSSFGRPEEVSGYTLEGWPDPDGVGVDPNAWISTAGADLVGGDGVPDEWTDPFTHCLDPAAVIGSQSPASLPRFISGRWGHNSNSDAEATLGQFTACGVDPVAAVEPGHWNDNACTACGVPRTGATGQPVQTPCRDATHTATSYWETTGGLHNIEDFDLGRFTAVDDTRVVASTMSQVPDPICAFSGEPVFGM